MHHPTNTHHPKNSATLPHPPAYTSAPAPLSVTPFFTPQNQLAIYVRMTYCEEIEKVLLDKVQKRLKKLPVHIVRNLQRWALQVESLGIAEVRKIPGYHDEPWQVKEQDNDPLDCRRVTGHFMWSLMIII